MLSEAEHRLNLLELKCRKPVEHLLAGEYRSVFKGRGIEFEDVRAYQPGDDVRTMDWKVTARTGEPHIKRYIEEREQYFYLLVDLSASMLHDPNGSKRAAMVEICSLLTMAAIKNQDRVGLILFTDQIEHIIPPGKGRSHAMRIMDALMNFQPTSKGTDFVTMLARFGHMARKHSVAFVVSDFLTDDYIDELQALAFRHDINAINLTDPEITASNLSGLIRMQDAETDTQKVIDLTKQPNISNHTTTLNQKMLDSGVNLLDHTIGQDPVESLAAFFHSKQHLEG
ncbi:MAG: DUF58 domain-containing protein [Akkermansiaceae bacterium]